MCFKETKRHQKYFGKTQSQTLIFLNAYTIIIKARWNDSWLTGRKKVCPLNCSCHSSAHFYRHCQLKDIMSNQFLWTLVEKRCSLNGSQPPVLNKKGIQSGSIAVAFSDSYLKAVGRLWENFAQVYQWNSQQSIFFNKENSQSNFVLTCKTKNIMFEKNL